MSADHVAMAMLAMSETLRNQKPPKLKMAIKCARGALKLFLSPPVQAHCHLQLGKLLFFYTDVYDLTRQHLETAYSMMIQMGVNFVEQRLEALSFICELYIHCRRWKFLKLLHDIGSELTTARQHELPLYYHKLLLYYIEINTLDNNSLQAFEGCNVALETVTDPTIQLYFRITKNLISCRLENTEVDAEEMTRIGSMIQNLESDELDRPHMVNLKFFYMCTKLAHMLTDGQTRSSRGVLRAVQNEVGTLVETVPINGIRWMDTMPMTVFACLMTIVNSMLQCNYERALKYFRVAIKHVDDLISKSVRTPTEYCVIRSVNKMRVGLLELIGMCNVMACKPSVGINNIYEIMQYAWRNGSSEMYNEIVPNIQNLLGLICCYMRDTESAEKHYLTAIKYQHCMDRNLYVMINVNLALLYLNECRMAEYYDVAERLSANRISKCSTIVKHNVGFLTAFHNYLQNKITECRVVLHDLLEAAKAEDLFRLHGLGILLLSNMVPVVEEVIKPTGEWSQKGLDHFVVYWSNIVLGKLEEKRGGKSSKYNEIARQSFDFLELRSLTADLESSPHSGLLQLYDQEPSVFLSKEDILS
ncbi:unnamed protein product [Caenorhabditis auriculariae]|uniref:MAU2 chromatid cohesion factor homolog n=1 Tax=Caenorhabditis auriculariae TaxID=2777116 RepID=A0A8S1H655_9PELO|nr:unnamed protein product [Caenorhabditis auriculariae]